MSPNIILTCRYNDAWTCTLFRKEDDKNTVDQKTCNLCLKAREISNDIEIMNKTMILHYEMNTIIRTLNTYLSRLTKILNKTEDES